MKDLQDFVQKCMHGVPGQRLKVEEERMMLQSKFLTALLLWQSGRLCSIRGFFDWQTHPPQDQCCHRLPLDWQTALSLGSYMYLQRKGIHFSFCFPPFFHFCFRIWLLGFLAFWLLGFLAFWLCIPSSSSAFAAFRWFRLLEALAFRILCFPSSSPGSLSLVVGFGFPHHQHHQFLPI